MRKIFVILFVSFYIGFPVFAVEDLDEMEARALRRESNVFYTGESLENHWLWQPQTLTYTDTTFGSEVWMMTMGTGNAYSVHEYGDQAWSADGKWLTLAIDEDTDAFVRRDYTYNEIWITPKSDGSLMRPKVDAPSRTMVHATYTTWSTVKPDVYYGFGRDYSWEGMEPSHLYEVQMTDNGVVSKDIITVSDDGIQRDLPKMAITGDGKYILATTWIEGSTIAICDLVTESLVVPEYELGLNIDSYWGNASSDYDHWHDEYFAGSNGDYWIYFLPAGSNSWWRQRPWNTTKTTGPVHTIDHFSPYDWWDGIDSQKEVQMLNGASGIMPDFTGPYWSHLVSDRWGTHVAYSEWSTHSGPAVWDVENSVKTAFPNYSVSQQYAAWASWSDYPAYTGGDGLVGHMKYNDGSTEKRLVNSHTSVTDVFIKPSLSPDGTKILYRSNWLQSSADNGDIFYVVAYYPHPPEITSVSNGVVRFDWRTDQSISRGYTQRGWPNEATDNPPPPRETKKFRLWKSADGISNWEPIATIDANIFDKYDFSNGTWSSQKYWEITDPSPSGYYAVTSVEHSGLESQVLSNVFNADGIQTSAYPNNPGEGGGIINNFNQELIRYYNIYAEDSSAPTAIQQNRIASIPVTANKKYVDWLGNTNGTTSYIVTAVDTQGNESSVITSTVTHKLAPAIVDGQYTITWDDSNEIIIRADVNQDSQINTTDAMLTLRNSLGLIMTGTAWQTSDITGDVNCDNVSNSTDAMLLLRYSLGLDMDGTNWCI